MLILLSNKSMLDVIYSWEKLFKTLEWDYYLFSKFNNGIYNIVLKISNLFLSIQICIN